MKKGILFIPLLATTLNFGCRKSGTLQPVNTDFDQVNKIFRVEAYYKNAAYTCSITQIRPGSPINPYTFIQVQQNSNFNYGFTPAVGDTIKVVDESATGEVSLGLSYLDVNLKPIIVQSTPNGGSRAEFTYVVKTQ